MGGVPHICRAGWASVEIPLSAALDRRQTRGHKPGEQRPNQLTHAIAPFAPPFFLLPGAIPCLDRLYCEIDPHAPPHPHLCSPCLIVALLLSLPLLVVAPVFFLVLLDSS